MNLPTLKKEAAKMGVETSNGSLALTGRKTLLEKLQNIRSQVKPYHMQVYESMKLSTLMTKEN